MTFLLCSFRHRYICYVGCFIIGNIYSKLWVWRPYFALCPGGSSTPSLILFFLFSLFCPGYGHIHPITATGKTACIIYAVVGIPFTLIFLSALVQRLLAPTFKLLSSFIKMLPNMDTLQVGNNKPGLKWWYLKSNSNIKSFLKHILPSPL